MYKRKQQLPHCWPQQCWGLVVASVLEVVCKWMKQLPTMLKLQCTRVRSRDTADKAHWKRTQHCWPTTANSVGSYCVRLHVVNLNSTAILASAWPQQCWN